MIPIVFPEAVMPANETESSPAIPETDPAPYYKFHALIPFLKVDDLLVSNSVLPWQFCDVHLLL